jgi:hypothetical protein
MNTRKFLTKNYINFRAWKTNRKIVVIESDDWGSIRMRSKLCYKELLRKKIPVNKSYFTRNDALETNEDIFELQTILSNHKDHKGNHPKITMNSLVANPDFDSIINNGYTKYVYETIQESYKKNEYDSSAVLKMYKDCISKNEFFIPQFHGREHINVRKYMRNLKEGFRYDIEGIKLGCILGLTEGKQVKSRQFYRSQNYMAGFEIISDEHKSEILDITAEGLDVFEQIFNFKSKCFTPQSLIWGDFMLPLLEEKGIEYIQGAQQFIPLGDGSLKLVDNFTGHKTVLEQILWRRNASFEPSSNPSKDWVDNCLREISIAFKWKTPAIINSHRVNYIGSINQSNRDNSLIQFDALLKAIVIQWPNVEFLSSNELGDLIKGKTKG